MLRRLHHEQPESFAFTEANRAWAEAQITKYPEGRQASAVIPLLWRAQEQEGWLSRPAIEQRSTRVVGHDRDPPVELGGGAAAEARGDGPARLDEDHVERVLQAVHQSAPGLLALGAAQGAVAADFDRRS